MDVIEEEKISVAQKIFLGYSPSETGSFHFAFSTWRHSMRQLLTRNFFCWWIFRWSLCVGRRRGGRLGPWKLWTLSRCDSSPGQQHYDWKDIQTSHRQGARRRLSRKNCSRLLLDICFPLKVLFLPWSSWRSSRLAFSCSAHHWCNSGMGRASRTTTGQGNNKAGGVCRRAGRNYWRHRGDALRRGFPSIPIQSQGKQLTRKKSMIWRLLTFLRDVLAGKLLCCACFTGANASFNWRA